MTTFRKNLPQLSGELFLHDGGFETDLIFNHGIDIPEFAAHTLLPNPDTRVKVVTYFQQFLELAAKNDVGFILDAPTWKAHNHWKSDLGCTEKDLELANHDAVKLVQELRDGTDSKRPIVLNGITGPCGDAYAPENLITVDDAQKYHSTQIGWLADTQADMVSALTFTQSTEAAGYAKAAAEIDIPCVISFTVETDGNLPTGQTLKDAVRFVDEVSNGYPAYFMINCAHPDHFITVLEDAEWSRRICGLRCNASRQSHDELDACEVLDDGNPQELGRQYKDLLTLMPWLNVFGGCCGSDIRHVREIAKAVIGHPDRSSIKKDICA